MERISVTDFGPIQHAEIEIKPFCILIGHTSSGKSTVAKLLDLFNSQEFYFIEPKDNLVPFISLLKRIILLQILPMNGIMGMSYLQKAIDLLEHE